MKEFLKHRGFLLSVILLFILCKTSALTFPFFWDESWSYAPAIKAMYLHGPTLLPGAIDPFYSRGHPLLFYALAAGWMKIFGDSHIAQHSFALLISVLLIIVAHEVSYRLFNKRVAMLMALLLPLQLIFFVQSTMLFPEIMVGLLALCTLYFYTTGKYLFTFLSCSVLLFIKESGMVLGLVLGIHAAINIFNSAVLLKKRLAGFMSVAGAGLLIGIFYMVQHSVSGWYLFPGHTDLIKLGDWDYFAGMIRYFLEIIFYHDNRSWVGLFLAILSSVHAVRQKNIRFAALAVTGFLIYMIVDSKWGVVSRKLVLPAFLVSFCYTVLSFVRLPGRSSATQKKFLYLASAYLFAYLLFCSVNFFSARYLVTVIVLVVILFAVFIEYYVSQLSVKLWWVASVVIVTNAVFAFTAGSSKAIDDCKLGAFSAMSVQQGAINYLEQRKAYAYTVASGSFLTREHLTKPFTGFLRGTDTFSQVGFDINATTDFAVFDNVEYDVRYPTVTKDASFHLVYTNRVDSAWTEIYEHHKW